MVPRRNGPNEPAFACRLPSEAKPKQEWERFGMRSSGAIISLRSSGAFFVVLIARPVII